MITTITLIIYLIAIYSLVQLASNYPPGGIKGWVIAITSGVLISFFLFSIFYILTGLMLPLLAAKDTSL